MQTLGPAASRRNSTFSKGSANPPRETKNTRSRVLPRQLSRCVLDHRPALRRGAFLEGAPCAYLSLRLPLPQLRARGAPALRGRYGAGRRQRAGQNEPARGRLFVLPTGRSHPHAAGSRTDPLGRGILPRRRGSRAPRRNARGWRSPFPRPAGAGYGSTARRSVVREN